MRQLMRQSSLATIGKCYFPWQNQQIMCSTLEARIWLINRFVIDKFFFYRLSSNNRDDGEKDAKCVRLPLENERYIFSFCWAYCGISRHKESHGTRTHARTHSHGVTTWFCINKQTTKFSYKKGVKVSLVGFARARIKKRVVLKSYRAGTLPKRLMTSLREIKQYDWSICQIRRY